MFQDNRFERVLKRKYRRMSPDDPNRADVAHMIADDGDRHELQARLADRIASGDLPPAPAPAPGGHPILEQLIKWLEDNWLTILKEILSLLGK